MRVLILTGYRGRPSHEQYLAPGEQDVDDSLGAYLIANGHATEIQEPAAKPADDERQTRRSTVAMKRG